MTKKPALRTVRCAVYTRKSSEEGLDQNFNSLDAQREACEAYVASQRHEGWQLLTTRYDDGGFSGGNLKRPALKRLLDDIEAGVVDLVVVYKIDRLTRSLMDFAKLVEVFDRHETSFVSVTQHFNTTSSMGRLTLNVLLSFAQFEREVTGERIRDKVAASKKKGMWMGGPVPLGYRLVDKRLEIDEAEAPLVRRIFKDYVRLGCVQKVKDALDAEGITGRARLRRGGSSHAKALSRGALYAILQRHLYCGETRHDGQSFPGQHERIISDALWNATQARLAENRRDRTLGKTSSVSLLSGLIFDANGDRLSPSHTVKGGKRYRYYLARPVETGGQRLCLPAHDVERIVTEQWVELLRSQDFDERLGIADATVARDARVHAQDLAQAWANFSVASQREWLVKAKLNVTVARRAVSITIDQDALTGALGATVQRKQRRADGPIELVVDAALAKVAGETRILEEQNGVVATMLAPAHRTLLQAVAQGRDWARRLAAGEFVDADDICAKSGLSEAHVARGIKCMALRSSLVAQLAEGRAPTALTWANIRANRLPTSESPRPLDEAHARCLQMPGCLSLVALD